MLGILPDYLTINGVDYGINTDYRIALAIFAALEDPDLSEQERAYVILMDLFEDFEQIPAEDLEEALKQAAWFLDGGRDIEEDRVAEKRVIDWVQDEQMIFSGVNKVACREIRDPERHLHWWTFLSYFNEIGEGLFSTVINIRQKRNKGQKLEKYEEEFLRKNKNLVILKDKLSAEEEKNKEWVMKKLGL